MTDITLYEQQDIMESVMIKGDLSKLSPQERSDYYFQLCHSLRLNPLTKPFEYITLNGKLTLYARKDATEQLRKRDRVSVVIAARERMEDVYVVTARATMPDGRTDESIGAVAIGTLKGEALANAFMKAETKAKRRVTLSICGLGILDETEVETIPNAQPFVEAQYVEVEPVAPQEPLATKEQKYAIGAKFAQLGLGKPSDVPAWLEANGFDAKLLSYQDAENALLVLDDVAAAKQPA